MRNEATIVLGQRKLLQRFGPGLIHAFIFWGFLVLAPTILIAMIGVVSKHSTLPWLGHQGWFAFLVDVFAVLVLVGVVGALWIRKVQRPTRFEGSHLGEADLILALIATIATTLLLWHADPDRARAQRVAGLLGARLRSAVATCSLTMGPPACSSACSSGPTSSRSCRSWPTCRGPSTCTSPPPPSTSGMAAPDRAGGSSRCALTTPTFPRRTSASAPGPPPT